MKRILSFFVVLALTLSLLSFAPLSIEAAEKSHLQLIVDLGIVPEYTDYGIIPVPYTRGDFAQTLCLMTKKTDGLGLSEERAKGYASDIATHKHLAYIATVLELGWMENDSSGAFRPTSPLTQEDAVKAIVKMLGYEPMAQANGGTFDEYYRIALKLNILKGVKVQNASGVSLLETSQIVANAMAASFFLPDNLSGMDECLWDRWQIKEKRGRIIANPNMGMYVSKTNEKEVNIEGTTYYTELLIENEMVGSIVTFYTMHGTFGEEVVSIYVDEHTKNLTIKSSDINSVSDNGSYLTIKYEDKKSIKMTKLGFLIVNGTAQSPSLEVFNAFKSGTVTFVDTDYDSVYDTAQMTLLYQAVIEGVNADLETLALRFDNTVINLKDKDYSVYLSKNAATLAELKKGMVVGIATDRITITGGEAAPDYTNSKYYQFYASKRSEEGYVTALMDDDQVEISEITYNLGASYYRFVNGEHIPELRLGEFVVAYYDNCGALAYYEFSASGNSMQYGYLVEANVFGTRHMVVEIKVLDTSGKFQIYPLSEKIKLDGARVEANSLTYSVNNPNDVDLLKRQLIRYRVVDDIVKEIDTQVIRTDVETASSSLDNSLAFDPYTPGESKKKLRAGAVDRRQAFASDAIVFVDSAYLSDTQPSERDFSVKNASSYRSGEYYIGGYDSSADNEMKCAVIYGKYGQTRPADGSSVEKEVTGQLSVDGYSSYVVTKVVNTTNKDDEMGWTLSLSGEDSTVSYFANAEDVRLYTVRGDYENERYYYTVDEEDVADFNTIIRKGDIVRFRLNSRNEFDLIERVFDFTANKDTIIPVPTEPTTKAERSIAFVKVEKISGNNIIYSYDGVNDDYSTYVSRKTTQYTDAIVYYVETGEVKIVPISNVPSAATGNNVKCFIRYVDSGILYDNIFYVYD